MKHAEHTERRAWRMGVLAAGCSLLGGCAHLGHAPEVGPALEISTQYAPSTGPRVGFNTFEVYLRNRGRVPINFTSIRLDNAELPMPKSADSAKGQPMVSLSIDGMPVPLNPSRLPDNPVATWWQFYPTAKAAPGQTVVFQINFREPFYNHRITLVDDRGITNGVIAPRFRASPNVITAVTYLRDFSKVFVQYVAVAPVERVWINGQCVRKPKTLTGEGPNMLVVQPSFRIRKGMPLCIRLEFADGSTRQAIVRALSGISLHTPPTAGPERTERMRLGLDAEPPVEMLPYDVACADLSVRRHGDSARAVVPERLRLYAKEKGTLAGVGFCTARFPELWNIYGPIADVAIVKPYSLGWGRNLHRFLEEEEGPICLVRQASAPRPFYWVPERFKKTGRYIEPEEMEVLAWMAIAQGAKGIRYHFWMNGPTPFADCPLLPATMVRLDRQIRLRENLLSPLVFANERVCSDDVHGVFKVYTDWCGNLGMLVLVRNLNYSTDGELDDAGRAPRFSVAPKTNLMVSVRLPAWVTYGGVHDFLTGTSLSATVKGSMISVTLDELRSYRLLWIGNGSEEELPAVNHRDALLPGKADDRMKGI